MVLSHLTPTKKLRFYVTESFSDHLPSKHEALSSSSSAPRKKKKLALLNWAPVAHTCNPSYSGSREQVDLSSEQAWANSSQDPILKKKKNHKKGLVEWFKV
jgi:hypothetical protein